jgi:putative addiction module killer protein
MISVVESSAYRSWFEGLCDIQARARIDARLRRISLGNFGDAQSVGGGVRELRIDYGPGYRVYFTLRGQLMVLLLCGGDKRTQASDIKRAKKMAENL